MMYARQGLLDEYELGLDRANAADLSALRGSELQRLVVQNERCKAKQAALDAKLMRAYDASGEWALEGALKPQGYLGTILKVPSKSSTTAP